jgi:hypothetical protein
VTANAVTVIAPQQSPYISLYLVKNVRVTSVYFPDSVVCPVITLV